MNKIYKVVWSKVKNCYVVVSEIAKNVITGSVKSAKIGSTPMAKGLALGAMMAFVITGSAMANEVITTDKTITGGVYVENNGAANPAKGGALQIVSSNVTIEGSYFEANHATERGASIHTGEGAEVTITNSEFRDHKLVNYGTAQKPKMKPYGAIYAQSGSTITLDGVVFDGNDTTCVHLDDSELIFKGSNAFLNTNNNAIVMTDGDQDLVNTQPILTFAQNSNTLFSGGSGYDFGTTKNFGVINVESGATVVSEGGFTLHDDTEVNLAGTVELGANNTTVIGVLKGEDGTIAVDSEWFGTGKKALNIKVNESTGTVIKVRDLDLKGGAANVLAGVVDDLKDVVDNTGSELVFATAAVDSVLRGDVELKDDKVTTTMDTDDLVVKGDVKATTFNGIKVEDLAKIEYVNAELSKKVDNKAVGQNAIAMGFNAKATGNDSAALGYGAEADNFAATAIGREASASGHSATAIGENASATGSYGNAIGFNATADASSANAMGAYAKATGGNSIAIGSVGKSDAPSTEALDQYAIAIGSSAKAKKANAIAVGQLSLAGRNSIAIGQGTVADAGGDDVAVAIGYQASATKDGAIAVGRFANAAGNSSVAFGASTTAVEPRTTAIGYKAQATYRSDLALGSHAITDKVHSVDSVNIGGKAYIVAGINNDESFVAAASFGGGASGTASDDKTIYRQLQYVAAGQVDKDSTDAVNGSQLFAAYEAIEASVADVTVLEEKTQNITAAEGKTTFATKGDGKITIKDIAGNTMLYGTNA
ncbi:MAG: hypothetical protein IJ963_00360, partial [Phascolarctobacterium sp.]|nr:hypothetical protein [Phascolarctobacterium sp.]